ncbi:type II secretion system F family protein [Streptomonospora wellingtoniae]|uniref:Type II secretion system F family protein n=1 Tax=Streptomonospora wellingtoniae TaxID=3075544 RepID=A0ABU2KY99_9ACTN|nr:type II secretion system F family protein [Streptomonospora sp. DSM 45055]MDT0304117.1 type II secretion system F family protein [Streptomonospora sp. DSM 45055]
MPFAFVLALGLGAAAVVAVFCWGLYLFTKQSEVAGDITAAPPRAKPKSTFILNRLTELIGRPFLGAVRELVGEERQESIRLRIEAAGRPESLTVERYLQRKTGEILLYSSAALLLLSRDQTMLALLALAFVLLTDAELLLKTQQRQDDIQRQLPDFLDVLAVSVGSGLAFRQALARVADAMPGTLSDEFRIVLRQMDLGTSRKDAFQALRDRNSNESLGKFVTAIQQSEELGAPLSHTLLNIGQDMRRQDAQYMRRKAQRINPRVTGITAATMLPGLLLLVGGAMILGSGVDFGGVFTG